MELILNICNKRSKWREENIDFSNDVYNFIHIAGKCGI